jgi:hypothetical protein
MIARLVTVAVGLWLMAAPAVLDYAGAIAVSDRVTGPVLASLAAVAVSEVLRPLRWTALPLALWLVAVPWILGATGAAMVNSVLSGLLVAALAPLGGKVRQRFGGGWRAVVGRAPR